MAQKTVKVMFIGDVVGTPGLKMVDLWLKNFIKNITSILSYAMAKMLITERE